MRTIDKLRLLLDLWVGKNPQATGAMKTAEVGVFERLLPLTDFDTIEKTKSSLTHTSTWTPWNAAILSTFEDYYITGITFSFYSASDFNKNHDQGISVIFYRGPATNRTYYYRDQNRESPMDTSGLGAYWLYWSIRFDPQFIILAGERFTMYVENASGQTITINCHLQYARRY